MGKEKKIKWLQRFRRAYEEVIDLEYQIRSDRELTAFKLSETHAINNSNALDEVLIRLEDLKEEYILAYQEMLKVKKEIEGALTSIGDSKAARVLRLRYIELCEWAEIADRMHYSRAAVFRFHALGLEELKLLDSQMRQNETV